MQGTSSNRFAGIIETDSVIITEIRGIAQQWNIYIRRTATNLLGRIYKTHFQTHSGSLESRHEVAIMYFGRTRERLLMTSERMVIPSGRHTLGQLLCNLYKRGYRWADALDDSNLLCTVNGRDAKLFDAIEAGAKICISPKE